MSHYLRLAKRNILIFFSVFLVVLIISYIRTILVMPSRITVFEGEEYICDFKSPFYVSIKADNSGIININNINNINNTNKDFIKLSKPIRLKPKKKGIANIDLKIYGLIPLRLMHINVVPKNEIAACGNSVGIKMNFNGILVVALSDVDLNDGSKTFPAKQSGLKPGDILLEANNTQLKRVDDLINHVNNSNGSSIKFKFKRGSFINNIDVTPAKSHSDNKYHIGAWARDNTVGIGTLTYYNPQNMYFGALGHGITDIDLGALMPVSSGQILETSVLSIKKGKHGTPGELKGTFTNLDNELGKIKENCNFGIFGKINADAVKKIPSKYYQIGLKSEIHPGSATILANIDNKTVEEYTIEIQRVLRNTFNDQKGLIIKVTDKRLLDKTGGIVQGMSGSPIIQDNRLIGAVTHVLINDPTRGFGIFIENMLNNFDEQKLKKAG